MTEVAANQQSATTPDLIQTTTETLLSNSGSEFQKAFFQVAPNWSDESARRFDALVIKEALGVICLSELHELEFLQSIRSRNISPISGDEILQQHRRLKIDEGMLTLLHRYVRIESDPVARAH